MYKKNKISAEKAIELEKWLLKNYKEFEANNFSNSNFTEEENIYLQEAYRIPLWDIINELKKYNLQGLHDIPNFIDYLCR